MKEQSAEGKAEVKIAVDKGTLAAMEEVTQLLRELKPELPELSREKAEEAIELMSEVREKVLPEMPTFKEFVQVLGEREAEARIKFNNLTLDGEAEIVLTPLKERK